MKDHEYYFHQSPPQLCKDLISQIDFSDIKILYEPFAGENNFYNAFPKNIPKFKSEIEDNEDYLNFDINANQIDTIISNPPFKLNGRNVFFHLIIYFFSFESIKQVYFLCNDFCWGSLTPSRRKLMEDDKIFINEITTCSVKKWRGRYFFIKFSRNNNNNFKYLLPNYE